MESVPLDADDRVLVVAPHPDDETLGAGGLIQYAKGTAAALAVVFLTDGENNPWAQRAAELRWRIGPPERGRFAVRRRAEALAALQVLGADPASASFMGLPDQGLTSLLLHNGGEIDGRLRGIFASFSPTLVVGPSFADLHPDHSAAAVALDIAAGPAPPFRRLAYTVHRPVFRSPAPASHVVRLDAAARRRKRRAILAHRTQLRTRGPWLLSFVRAEEPFLTCAEPAAVNGHPIRSHAWAASGLRLSVATRSTLRAFGRRNVLLVTAAPERITSASAALPASGGGSVIVRDGVGRPVAGGCWNGSAGRGMLELPCEAQAAQARLYVKLQRRFGFFDEAGWRRLTAHSSASHEAWTPHASSEVRR